MPCHVDACWCCWKNLEWSSSNHLRIIFESSWWLSLVVWLFGCFWSIHILHHWGGLHLWCFWHCWFGVGWVVQSHLFETSFPSSNLRNPQKACRNCHGFIGFIDVSCLVSCLESTFFLRENRHHWEMEKRDGGRWEPRTSASARSCVNRVADWREFRRSPPPQNTLRLYNSRIIEFVYNFGIVWGCIVKNL